MATRRRTSSRSSRPAGKPVESIAVSADGSTAEIAQETVTKPLEEPEAEDKSVVGVDGQRVEAVGSGSGAKGHYVYECSAGDFHSSLQAPEGPAAVEAHIASEHGKG